MTQCGHQSTEEAVSRGIPLVALPFIADQEMVAKRLVELEVAIGLDFVTFTKEDLKTAIMEASTNPKYVTKFKKKSIFVGQNFELIMPRIIRDTSSYVMKLFIVKTSVNALILLLLQYYYSLLSAQYAD